MRQPEDDRRVIERVHARVQHTARGEPERDLRADGRDVSWVWDADFELLSGRVRRITCAGTRAGELAVRLKYAGVPTDRLHVVPELAPALDDAVAHAPASHLYVLPTYTALLELRRELAERGHALPFWEPTPV